MFFFFVGNMKISVIFIGCEDENNNFCKVNSFERVCIIDNIDRELNRLDSLVSVDCVFMDRLFWKDNDRVEYLVKVNNSWLKRSDCVLVSFVLSVVKFMYCGLEVFDMEYEKFDKLLRMDK